MKKLLLTMLVTGAVAGNVLAQGLVNLPLQSTRFAQYTTDGTTLTKIPVGNPASVGTYGTLNIQLYYATDGTASPFTAGSASLLPAAWTASSTTPVHQIIGAAGYTPATIFTIPSYAAKAEVMIVGWTGAFADWNSALTAGTGLFGWTGSTLSGGSLAWSNAMGNSQASPPDKPVDLTLGANGYNGLVLAAIPEPTSFALAGLGLAALLAFRRRN